MEGETYGRILVSENLSKFWFVRGESLLHPPNMGKPWMFDRILDTLLALAFWSNRFFVLFQGFDFSRVRGYGFHNSS